MSDNLIQQIADNGYNISMDGPDVRKVNMAYQWTLRVFSNERDAYDHPIDRKMFHGASPNDVLAQAVGWTGEQRKAGEQA